MPSAKAHISTQAGASNPSLKEWSRGMAWCPDNNRSLQRRVTATANSVLEIFLNYLILIDIHPISWYSAADCLALTREAFYVPQLPPRTASCLAPVPP